MTRKIQTRWLIAACLIVCAGCATENPPHEQTYQFLSDDGRTIQVSFCEDSDHVQAVLWDGTQVTLPHAISASGARFTDGQMTIWNKGDNIMVLDETTDDLLFEGEIVTSDDHAPCCPR